MIIAKGREIKEFSEIISVEEQITEINFTPDQGMSKKLEIKAFDAITKDELPNVLLRLRKSNSKISAEGLTKEQGIFIYYIDANCTYQLEIQRKGYISYQMEFNQTKGNEHIETIKVPLFPVEKIKPVVVYSVDPEHENQYKPEEVKPGRFRAILVSDYDSTAQLLEPTLHACVSNPENTEAEELEISSSNKEYTHQSLNATYKDHDELGKLIIVDTMSTEENSKWFRLSVNITSSTLTENNFSTLDQNFKNTLQDHNTKMLIFDEKKLISIVYVPNFVTNQTVWDIGLANPSKGKFIKINN
jgi:hypothetical protein